MSLDHQIGCMYTVLPFRRDTVIAIWLRDGVAWLSVSLEHDGTNWLQAASGMVIASPWNSTNPTRSIFETGRHPVLGEVSGHVPVCCRKSLHHPASDPQHLRRHFSLYISSNI